MMEIRRTVLVAAALIAMTILFTGGQECTERVADVYLDAPAVAILPEQRMMPAVANLKTMASRGTDVNAEDLYLLAKIIECEARYEPYEGKVAVGAVVLNRVMSGKFPNTIKGVIFQKGQFQPITDGGWDSKEPSELSFRAAKEALRGVKPIGDNGQTVGNAQFFIYESLAGSRSAKWFKERLKYVTTIGNHDFYCR